MHFGWNGCYHFAPLVLHHAKQSIQKCSTKATLPAHHDTINFNQEPSRSPDHGQTCPVKQTIIIAFPRAHVIYLSKSVLIESYRCCLPPTLLRLSRGNKINDFMSVISMRVSRMPS